MLERAAYRMAALADIGSGIIPEGVLLSESARPRHGDPQLVEASIVRVIRPGSAHNHTSVLAHQFHREFFAAFCELLGVERGGYRR